MRKTFLTGFKAFCVGAMALAAVSCYDDSALRAEIDSLDERLTKVEKDLNEDIKNLSDLQATVANLETSLRKAIADGDAAVQKALEDKLTALEAKLNKAIQDGDKALADQLAAEKKTLTETLAALQAGLTSVTSSVEALQQTLTALEATVNSNYQTLLGKLDAADGVVDGYVKDITAAIAALQQADKDINAALLEAIAKISVVKVAEVDGKIVLTLADGSTVSLSKPLTNVDNNGLVTIVEVDGVKYWAIVGKEGHTGVEVGHPDQEIEFQVNAQTGELEYRVNGGEWISTGLKAAVQMENAAVITDFVDGEEYVEIVINGTKVVLPKYVADNSDLELTRTEVVVPFEGAKKVEVFAEGVADCYVMSKPDGWKAKIEDGILTVTAPKKAAVEIGAAETKGEVLLHATTAAGTCKVVKLDVEAIPGLTLEVDTFGNITVNNALASEKTNMWGDTSFGFTDFVFGLATPAEFNKDPKAYVEFYNSNWSAPVMDDIIFPSFYNVAEQGMYVEGEYEIDVVKYTVAEAYFMWYYSELPAGANFVVWVAPADAEGKAVVSDMVYTDYVNIKWEVAVKSATHSDITLTASVAGASKYIIGCVAESDYNNEWSQSTFEEYMLAPMGGPWTGFKNYGASNALGMEVAVADVPAEFNLSDLLGDKLAFGTNYKVWVMPLFDHLAKLNEAESVPEYDYYVYDFSGFDFHDHFMPFVLDAKTNEILAGGAHQAELTLNKKDFTSIYVNVTPSEGTESVYYAWYTPKEYAEFESDAEVFDALLMDCYFPLTEAEVVNKSYITPGEEWVLATVSVGTDGKYGEVVAQTFATTAIPYDSSIKATLDSLTKNAETGEYTAVFSVTGATKFVVYNYYSSSASAFPTNVCKSPGTYTQYKWADVVDGKATIVFKPSSASYDYLIYAGYNMVDTAVSGLSEQAYIQISTSLAQ